LHNVSLVGCFSPESANSIMATLDGLRWDLLSFLRALRLHHADGTLAIFKLVVGLKTAQTVLHGTAC